MYLIRIFKIYVNIILMVKYFLSISLVLLLSPYFCEKISVKTWQHTIVENEDIKS